MEREILEHQLKTNFPDFREEYERDYKNIRQHRPPCVEKWTVRPRYVSLDQKRLNGQYNALNRLITGPWWNLPQYDAKSARKHSAIYHERSYRLYCHGIYYRYMEENTNVVHTETGKEWLLDSEISFRVLMMKGLDAFMRQNIMVNVHYTVVSVLILWANLRRPSYAQWLATLKRHYKKRKP